MFGWIKDRFRRGNTVPVVRLSGVIAAGGMLGGRGLSLAAYTPEANYRKPDGSRAKRAKAGR